MFITFKSIRAGFAKAAVVATLVVAGAIVLNAGCADHGQAAIPAGAERLASGDGRDVISATAPNGGTAYVLDRDDNKVVWSGEVHTDDKIVVDGTAHKIRLDGRTVAEDVYPNHRYTISFYRPV